MESSSPRKEEEEEEEEFGDMSLPPDQRRHLMEMESSFRPDPVSERDTSPVRPVTGDMGPPPLPVGRRKPDLRRVGSRPVSRRSASKDELLGSQAEWATADTVRRALGSSEPDDGDEKGSSPSYGAHARTLSSAASSLSGLFRPPDLRGGTPSSPSPRPEEQQKKSRREGGDDPDRDDAQGTDAAQASASLGAPAAIPSKSSTTSIASNSSYKVRRPKFLRSRQSLTRSSISSSTSDMHDDDGASTITAGDNPPGVLSRSTSLGSIASGITGLGTGSVPVSATDRNFSGMSAADRALARLDEEERNSPTRRLSPADGESSNDEDDQKELPTTPKDRAPELPPTDTVINAQAKNMQVPPTVARDFKAKHSMPGQPMSPSKRAMAAAGTPGAPQGKNMTLKEQTAIIDRLQKENFDLKLKLFYLDQRLDKLSDEGVKEMMQDNVDMKLKLGELARERKALKKQVRELEKKIEEVRKENKEPSEEEQEREREIWELRETVERYELEIEEYQQREKEREERMRDARRAANGTRNEEVEMLRDYLEAETARRESVDLENRRLRDEINRLRAGEARPSTAHSMAQSTTSRSRTGHSDRDSAGSYERNYVHQLKVENDELRREVSAQTSMLTSRNREKEQLYQQIEDLKMQLRVGGGVFDPRSRAPSIVSDRLLDRSVSRAGRPVSVAGTQVSNMTETERDDYENANGALRDRISELRLKNQQLEIQLEQAIADLDQFEEELVVAQSQVQQMQIERNDALREREETEMDFDQLKEEAEEEIQRIEEELEARIAEIERLEEEARNREEDFDALQQELRNVSDIVVRLEDATETQHGEAGALQEKIEELQRTVSQNEQEMNVLEDSLREANEKIERLTVQGESAKSEIAFLREEQDGDKIKIGELEATIKMLNLNIEEEKERVVEAKERLDAERKEREEHGDLKQAEFQRALNEKSEEVAKAKDEVRRLRTKVQSREEEAQQWRSKLEELESSLRGALGEVTGTRSGFAKSIINLHTELENTLEELDYTKNELSDKERVLKDRENLLESMALENRKMTELLDKERAAHRSTKTQLSALEVTTTRTAHLKSTHSSQLSEIEKSHSRTKSSAAALEIALRAQIDERNTLLLSLWDRLSQLCGSEWKHRNSHVSANAGAKTIPMSEAITGSAAFASFAKTVLAGVKAIEGIVAGFRTKCRAVEKDLWKEYQVVENALESRTRRLDRLENLVRGGIDASSSLRTEIAKLRAENRLLKAEVNVIKNEAAEAARPGLRRSLTGATLAAGNEIQRSNSTASAPGGGAPGSVGAGSSAAGEPDAGEKRWILRLRELEKRLKAEREARLLDRSMAKRKVEEARGEKQELERRLERERVVAGGTPGTAEGEKK